MLARQWIIGRWLEHAAASAQAAGVDYSFVLLGGIDDPTFRVVESMPQYQVACVYVEEPRKEDVRDWTKDRFPRMCELRNTLLQYVRLDEPDYFLSLDTDVLLHPEAIANLIETQQQLGWAAVGGYCYLSDNRANASYANLPAPWVLHRPDMAREIHVCDVVMAIVLMTQKAWSIDYEHSDHGEDIGHGMAMKRARLKVGVDARVINRHIMRRSQLDVVDKRCGW